MESLSRFVDGAGAALIAVVLVGCASGPEPAAEVPALPEPIVTWVTVQSIPRGAWIEVDGGYQGTAPVTVAVEVNSLGKPRRVVQIRATDVVSGAFEEKRFYGRPMPDKVLFDLRPWIVRPEVLTF
jgi:hypothetical protein